MGCQYSFLRRAAGFYSLLALVTVLAGCGPSADDLLRDLKAAEMEKRQQALTVLVKIKEPRAVEPFMVLVQSDESAYMRRKAAFGLGVLGDPQAVPILVEAAQKDTDEFVREAAIEALGQLKAAQAKEMLVSILETAEQPRLRKASAFALGAIGQPEAVSSLVAALQDPNPPVRAATAWALGALGQKEAVRPLIALLVEESDKSVKAEVAKALGRLEDRRAILPLVEALQDRDPKVKERSAEAIEALSAEVVQRALILGLKEEVTALRTKVAALEESVERLQDQTQASLQRLEQRTVAVAKPPAGAGATAPSQDAPSPVPATAAAGPLVASLPANVPPALAPLVPRGRPIIVADLDKFTYTGIRGCRCHLKEHEGQVYKERKHREAFKRLKGKDQKNPKCLKCHATAFGKKVKGDKPFLKGNQCEACHGPGSDYKDRPLKELYRKDPLGARKKSMELGLLIPGINIDKKKLCAQCHWDGKDPNAPNKCPKFNKAFDFEKAYKKMKHTNVDPIDKVIATLSPKEREKWAGVLPAPEE